MSTHRVGAVYLDIVIHGSGMGSGAWMFPQIDPDERQQGLVDHVDQADNLQYVYSSAILRTPTGVILVDAGFRSEAGAPPIVHALARLGHSPADVAAVVITHGHADHVGGLVDADGSVVFGRARHLIGVDELDHLGRTEPEGPIARVAAAGLIEPVAGSGDLTADIGLVATPGHTPGHLAVEIESNGARALLAGDVIAHEVNVSRPDWNHFSDTTDALATRSRHALVARAASGGHLISASHMTTVGHAVEGAGGLAVRPATKSLRGGSRW